MCVCQLDRTEHGVLTRTTCPTGSVSPISYWPIWPLTSPEAASNAAWMVRVCVFVCECVSLCGIILQLFFGGKIDLSVPDFRETPLMERFCSAYAPLQSIAQNVAFTLEKSLWNAADQLKRICTRRNFTLYIFFFLLPCVLTYVCEHVVFFIVPLDNICMLYRFLFYL